MRSRQAFTLIELIVVLSILIALATVVVPLYSGTVLEANEVTTKRSLSNLAASVQDYWTDTKHVTLDGIITTAAESERFEIRWLFQSPVTGDLTQGYSANTRIGWRGPYISHSTGDPAVSATPFMIDAWQQSIVLQDVDSTADLRDVRVVSGGPDGIIQTPAATASASLTSGDTGDDIYVVLSLR